MNVIKFKFNIKDLHPTIPILFTKISSTSKLNQDYLRDNSDKFIHNNIDYSAIVYLNSHNIDFTGGSITFNDTHSVLNIEPKMGIFFSL